VHTGVKKRVGGGEVFRGGGIKRSLSKRREMRNGYEKWDVVNGAI
jgi:hypothetical protein